MSHDSPWDNIPEWKVGNDIDDIDLTCIIQEISDNPPQEPADILRGGYVTVREIDLFICPLCGSRYDRMWVEVAHGRMRIRHTGECPK